jgi:2-oxo-3-hexenedioate decarboxylase
MSATTVWDVRRVAAELLARADGHSMRDPIAAEWPALDVDTAYQVQDEVVRLRLARGEVLVGVKLDLTNAARQRRMGIASPLTAWLTDTMKWPDGEPVMADSFIHPRVEPELVFVLGERLAGPGATAPQALAAVRNVYGGAEIIDSRYTDFRFTLPDLIADNASSGAFVTGPVGLPPSALDLTLEAVLVEADGAVVDSATGAAVQGHPAEALALAAADLARRGFMLEPGWVVLTGGMTDAVPLAAGHSLALHFSHLGSVYLGSA